MKILINGITLDNANIVPLLTNARYWQTHGAQITVMGNRLLKEKIGQTEIIREFEFVEIRSNKKISSNLELIFEGLKRNFLALSKLKRMKYKYDVIYSRSSVLDLILFPYILKIFDQRIKWATVFDNTVAWSQTSRKLAWLFYQISLVFLKKADKVFAVSAQLKKYLIDKGFHPERVVVTGNAVEAELIKRAAADGKYRIDALFLGRINELKGVYDMLEVLGEVIKKYPDFQLGIVGEGDSLSELEFKERIKQMNLEKNIQFFGYVAGQEKFNIIKSSKIFWFLSQSESFGLALLEAVCSGKSALTYDLKAYDKIYLDDEIYRFSKGDIHGIADKTIDIFENREFENKRGRLLLDRYGSWERIAEIEYRSLV